MNKIRLQFGVVTFTNISTIWVCVCLITHLIALGTNSSWYIRQDERIRYWHGGLWSQCMGDIGRTFCSPLTEFPDWLKASRAFILLALLVLFIHIVYVMVGTARKSLRLSVMSGLANITALFTFISVMTYTLQGFSTNIKPGDSFYMAWMNFVFQLICSILMFYTFLLVSKIDDKMSLETGIMM